MFPRTFVALAAVVALAGCATEPGAGGASQATSAASGSQSGTVATSPAASASTPAVGTPTPSTPASELQAAGIAVVEALRDRDYARLAALASPDGVRFSPWGFVDTEGDIVLNPEQIAALATDTGKRNWGAEAGSGEPIEATWAEYNERFGYSHDFANPHVITENDIVAAGSTTNNIAEVYPGDSYVDYHINGSDPEVGGLDWASLRVVLAKDGEQYRLVGLVHDSWTP